MTNLADRTFRRILLIKPSSLGDVVHALPVLHGLRQRYPKARISWLLASSLADLLAGQPDLDEIIPFDRARFGGLGRSLPVTAEFTEFLRQLRARRFDLALDLQGLFRSGFLATASGAPVRIGFADARELAWVFYTHRLTAPSPDTHAADRNYLVASLLGFADLPMRCELHLTAAERDAADRLLRAAGLAPDRPFAVLAPGARWETKRWPTDKFAQLAGRIVREANMQVVVVGSLREKHLGAAVAAQTDGAVCDLVGRTSLRELMAVIAAADLVVTNDSGTKDIASAFARPLVCLFGPTNPVRTGPMLGRGRVVRLALDCSPCYLRKLSRCPHEHRCLAELDVDAVFAEALRLVSPRFPLADTIASSR